MSEMAIAARAKAREKAERLTRSPKGDIDASGWREPLGEQDMAPGLQTGPRPVSRRQFRAGGTVHGGKFAHAGRKPRASGGMTANEFQNRNMKSANDEREGPKHLGGMKKGGRAHKATGGNMTSMALPQAFTTVARATGGRTHGEGCKCEKCGGGRVGRAFGGQTTTNDNWSSSMNPSKRSQRLSESAMKMTAKAGTDPYDSQPAHARNYDKLWKLSGGKPARASGGGVSYGGSRPEGGRIARASGGRSKKGTTVNIIIAPSGGGAKPPMMPPPGAMPPPGPVGLHQGMPPAPPQGMPPGGAPPPMGAPMMRKAGGRAYPIDSGAGGGLGRIEKAKAYGETPVGGASPKPRKHGGRTNYPIKTGSGGGEARLAKIRAYGA